MLDPFELPFMQRAALEVVMLAPLAGLLGAQIVLRRLAFFTHGVGTATFPGLVASGPIGVPPMLAALVVGGGFAAALEWLAGRRGTARDAGTALLLVGCLAVGIILASDVFESGSGVDRLLFGSLLAIGTSELLFTATILFLALIATAVFRRTWIAAGFDDLGSGALGLRVSLANTALLVVVALAVVACLDAVGALLVTAILVIPAATTRLFAGSILALELGAAVLALAEGLGGLLLAYWLDVPPGAVVAVMGGALFALCVMARELVSRGWLVRTETS